VTSVDCIQAHDDTMLRVALDGAELREKNVL